MITLAQVGCGYWGPNLLRNFSALPGARVKYVVEASESRRRYVDEHFPKTRTLPLVADVLADPEVNALVLATPAQSHFPLARAALEAGKHVFVEKPLAMTVREVDVLDEIASRQKLTLMVGHTFLYNPAVLFLKQLVDSGELGEIHYLYSQRLNLGVVRSDINALWNLAPHDLSIFNFLLGAAPVTATAQGTDFLQKGVEDVVFAHFEYPGRARASVHVSWLDPNKVRKVTLVGSRKMAVYDDVADDKLAIYDKGIDSQPSAQPEALPFDRPPAGRLVYRSGDIHLPRVAAIEPLRAEAQDFLDAILGGKRPRSDATSGRQVVGALQAASLSLKENSRRVGLDEIVAPIAP